MSAAKPSEAAPLAVVVGARGTLGRALVEELPRAGWQLALAADRAVLDLREASGAPAVLARALGGRPGVVFNAAAYTDVDRAESEGDLSYAVNAVGVEALARACRDAGAALVHYSTDFVYDGELERPYDEFDPPSPQGVYARSKRAGEVLQLFVAENADVRVLTLPDVFQDQDKPEVMYAQAGLDADGIVRAALTALGAERAKSGLRAL